ncbi:hypothetical protein MRX96_002145 [Rhipicephalus microplus]
MTDQLSVFNNRSRDLTGLPSSRLQQHRGGDGGSCRRGKCYFAIPRSLGTTSLRFKVQKQTQDQERAEIHLEGKDARSDNEAARRTEDARQGVLKDMINKRSDKMKKMFEMLVVRLSDSEAESEALALKHDKRLEEQEKKIS